MSIAQGRQISKEAGIKYPYRGMQQVMSQNGPVLVDITAFQIAQACQTLKIPGMLEVRCCYQHHSTSRVPAHQRRRNLY